MGKITHIDRTRLLRALEKHEKLQKGDEMVMEELKKIEEFHRAEKLRIENEYLDNEMVQDKGREEK